MSQVLLTIDRYEEMGQETLFIAYGNYKVNDSFMLFLSPAPAKGEVMATLREILRPGWEEALREGHSLTSEFTTGVYLGRRIEREGRDLVVLRNFVTPEEMAKPNIPDVIRSLPPVLEQLAEEIERGAGS